MIFSFLLLLYLSLMRIHSFKNLLFPIDHFFPGPVRWTFGKTSLILAPNLFSLSPIFQYHNHKSAVLHRHTYSSAIHLPQPWAHAFSFIVHLFPIASSPAIFKHGEVCPLPSVYSPWMLPLPLFASTWSNRISLQPFSIYFSNFVALYCGLHCFHVTEIIPIKKWLKTKTPKARAYSYPSLLHIWQYC